MGESKVYESHAYAAHSGLMPSDFQRNVAQNVAAATLMRELIERGLIKFDGRFDMDDPAPEEMKPYKVTASLECVLPKRPGE